MSLDYLNALNCHISQYQRNFVIEISALSTYMILLLSFYIPFPGDSSGF